MAESTEPRIIKRYANRKLYDMSESCYITHDEIAQLLQQGQDVRIIDNRTKEDLTQATLTQILFDKERRTRKQLPLPTLKGLFQQGGDFIQQQFDNLREEAEKVVKSLSPQKGDARAQEEEVDADDAEDRPKATGVVRELVSGPQQAYEALQKNIEDRWNLVIGRLGEFDINHGRIAELEARVESLEAQLKELVGSKT